MLKAENVTFEYKNQDTDTGKVFSNLVLDNINLEIFENMNEFGI